MGPRRSRAVAKLRAKGSQAPRLRYGLDGQRPAEVDTLASSVAFLSFAVGKVVALPLQGNNELRNFLR